MEKKKGKGWMITSIILLILLLGAIGYICYDKLYVQCNAKDNEIKNESSEDIEKIASQLHNQLLSKNGLVGLYSKNKISHDDINNALLYRFYLANYIEDNKIALNENSTTEINGMGVVASIDKKDLNNYMKEKLETTADYEYTNSEVGFPLYESYGVLPSKGDSYNIYLRTSGNGGDSISTKLIDYKQEGNKLYLYDTAAISSLDAVINSCYLWQDYTVSDTSFKCTDTSSEDYCKDYKETIGSYENFADYFIKNQSDKLKTYKHTFEKQSDGTYLWISSEIVE